MNANYYRLVIWMTLKHPQEAQDIILRTTRTLPFPPVEDMSLVITNDENEEYEITLGTPRYEFAESAFVEYQEDESLIEYMRDGEYCPENRDELVNYYKSFGFEEIKPKVVVDTPQKAELSTQ